MSDFPNVAIVLLTFDRMEAAEPTLRAALDLIDYPVPLQVHIADDGSPTSYRERLREIAGSYPESVVRSVTVSDAERGGYGLSYNLACQATHEYNDYVLVLEDDWLLPRPLHLMPLVQALQEGICSCLRLGYCSVTQGIQGQMVDSPCGKLLLIDPHSPDQYVWCGAARLESVGFQRRVGEWPLGLSPGEVELTVCARPESRRGVAFPLDLAHPTEGLFLHTGSRSLNAVRPERVTA